MTADLAHMDALLQPLHADVNLRDIGNSIRNRSAGLLMLDYDGTLAPFVEQRDRAVPYPGVRPRLQALIGRRHDRVVIVSGRAVAHLRPLLSLDPLPEIWGSHGWERLHADGRYEEPRFTRQQRATLESEWTWLEHSFDPQRLERKPASVALHWRGLPGTERDVMEEQVRQRWSALAGDGVFDLHAFDGGLELRAAGKNKGDAVRALLQERTEGAMTAYCGDDATDEDAFAALEGEGLRVLVRQEPRPTQADVLCVPPEALLGFLDYWIEGQP